jgi:hypothetical protein
MSTAVKVPRSGRARLDGGSPLPRKSRVPGAGHLPRVQLAEQERDPGRPPTAFLNASRLLSLPSPPVYEVIGEQQLLARNVPTAAAAIPHRGQIRTVAQPQNRINIRPGRPLSSP